MATLKWKRDNYWLTFYYVAFEHIKSDLKNIIKAINNMASAIRMRCRRDYNLSDIYDAAEGRTNLGVINDCSALPTASHHHDSRYVPLIEKENRDRKNADEALKDRIASLRSRLNSMRECHK